MSLRGKVEGNQENLEKIGFIWIFLFSVLGNFFAGEALLFSGILVAGLIFLWGVYVLSGKMDFYKWPLILMIGFPLYRMLLLLGITNIFVVQYVYFAGLVLFGVYTLIETFRYSAKYKNFELLNFLMGVFLCIAPLAILFGNDLLERGGDYYFYALAFVLATVIYNDNLWERNGYNAKSLIKYVFVIAILSVLESSFSNISF